MPVGAGVSDRVRTLLRRRARAAHAPPAVSGRRFLIVTPVFNAGTFIDEAIASVLRQNVTDHVLHYHVQDGGSTDGTVERLQAWQRRLQDDVLVPHADQIVFTFASERDGGMYDALQRGFNRLAPRDDDILTWINSDDCLAQGSLVTVGGVFRDVPGCEFLSGRIALLNEAGGLVVLGAAVSYARASLAAGLHDGRTLPFVMQEGTFYSGRVWNAVGGVDTKYRLAGDWDLWRRMARVARHCTVDSVTGYHRRRAGQLSGDMDAYYREVDAAPALSNPSGLEQVGGFISYDVPSARWVETAYDPSATKAPTLLRDGRSEVSAICLPGAGFGVSEGPYAQYHLPGGIRWINDDHADVAILAPTTGRYRLRLTVRPSRHDLVIGLGIGGRTPQPVMLETPAPLTDQVIETERWLEAGENHLKIDCEGAPRSLLVIRCEATSIDDDFAYRPVSPSTRLGQTDRHGLAIVVRCEANEPDLLETTLASCLATMPTTPVFVVRHALNAALDCVAGRYDVTIDRGEGADLAADIAALRSRLHAAGHADVLVIRPGSLLALRGIDAASTLLDATGAGSVIGLVNERDARGSARRLVRPASSEPSLYRATGATDDRLSIGCALAVAIGKGGDIADRRVIWLLDGDRPTLGRTPAIQLAAGLALLGHDVCHWVVGARPLPTIASDAVIIASRDVEAPAAATAMTIERDGDRLRLTSHDGVATDLPLPVDADLLLPRDRAEARDRLGLASDERIACIAEVSADATTAIIEHLSTMTPAPTRILNFGHSPCTPVQGTAVLIEADVGDPLLLSYLLSAADIAVTSETGGGVLGGAAWSCGLTVLGHDGTILHPDIAPYRYRDIPTDVASARDLVVATRSFAAFALAIDAQHPNLGGPAPLSLQGGVVRVRSYGCVARPGGFDPVAGFSSVTIFGDKNPFAATDGERGVSVGGREAQVVVAVGHAGASVLHLHARGTPGDTWTAQTADASATLRIGEDGTGAVAVAGNAPIGPTSIRLTRESDDGALLHIVGLTVAGAAMTRPMVWEDTAFELVSADAQPAAILENDGDWQRVDGFLSPQAPVTPAGLLVPFQWNSETTCRVRVRVDIGGRRTLRLALSAGFQGQRVRPVIAGRAYDWSSPLSGPIGHVERRAWQVELPIGDIDIDIEVDDVLRTMPQEVGMLLFAVTLDPA